MIGVMSAELVSRLASRIVGRVSRRWRWSEAEPTGPADAAPAPTAAELARWRTAALSGALRHVSDQRAQQVADSVLAELVRMLAADAAPEHSSSPPTVLQSSGATGAGGPNADDADRHEDRHADGARGTRAETPSARPGTETETVQRRPGLSVVVRALLFCVALMTAAMTIAFPATTSSTRKGRERLQPVLAGGGQAVPAVPADDLCGSPDPRSGADLAAATGAG